MLRHDAGAQPPLLGQIGVPERIVDQLAQVRTIFQMSSVPIALADPLDADSRSE
jgi:hypothetical protein